MILKYEDEKRTNSVTHVAKALHKNKLPTAADLAALNSPQTTLTGAKKTITAANMTNYQSGEFLSQLENQLGTNKKNFLATKIGNHSPP